jgi:general nucleoside transport system permease protein
MLKLEPRQEPSRLMSYGSPLLAVVLTLVSGFVLFSLLGKDPVQAFDVFFVQPIQTQYGIGELLLKSTPLILCATGLALGFRANVWNIGAEGQLIVGAIVGGGIGLYFDQTQGAWLLPLMLLGGALGGMAWAAVPAFLRTRFHTSEILVSLMLVYVAQLLLSYLVHGPWRDPAGYNFPQSPAFSPAATVPVLAEGVRTNLAFVLAIVLAGLAWLFAEKAFGGFRLKVSGLAPHAASYAGFSERRSVWVALMLSGATAGLAGVSEVAGPIGQLQPSISPGYGFAAIIVAFVGRLHPFGVVLASLLMSLLYIGGETAQIKMALPAAVTGVFQGMLLFYLLAADLFIRFRLRWVARPREEPQPVAVTESA